MRSSPAFFFLAWHLRHTVIIAFGAVVVAALLLAATDATRRFLPLGHRWSLAVATGVIILVIGAILWVGWPDIRSQSSGLLQQLPQAVNTLEQRLGIQIAGSGGRLGGTLEGVFGRILRDLATLVQTAAAAVTGFVLVTIAGLYLAAEPGVYRTGLTLLVPPAQHDRAGKALDRTGRAPEALADRAVDFDAVRRRSRRAWCLGHRPAVTTRTCAVRLPYGIRPHDRPLRRSRPRPCCSRSARTGARLCGRPGFISPCSRSSPT
ncbi:hypothetical protein QW131_22725 [Roseibium salinum]|nr:hypothetical protein [Roseibium salinum]